MPLFTLSFDARELLDSEESRLDILVGGQVVGSIDLTTLRSTYNVVIDYHSSDLGAITFRLNDVNPLVQQKAYVSNIRVDNTPVVPAQIETPDAGEPDPERPADYEIEIGEAERIEFSPAPYFAPIVMDAPLAIVNGTNGNDTNLQGTASDDTVNGLNGNDTIKAWAGNDTVNGGFGNDIVLGGTGVDTLNGDDGDDRLFGEADNDVLNGGAGADFMRGGDGDDQLNGGNDNDTMHGDAGNDILRGAGGHDVMHGWDGNDSIYGEDGNDTMHGYIGDDYMEGGLGDDKMYGQAGADTMYGGDGSDSISGHEDNDQIDGGAHDDRLYGNEGDDILIGGTGDDNLSGNAGIDELYGDDGADVLDGHDGDDRLEGGIGNDILIGGEGNDRLYGEDGHDILVGGTGDDTLDGGDGDDILYAMGLQSYSVNPLLDADPDLHWNASTQSFYKIVAGATNYAGAVAGAAAMTLAGTAGHLVGIDTAIENTFLIGITGGASLWTAGNDQTAAGTWVWDAGAANASGVNFWDETDAVSYGQLYLNFAAGPTAGNGDALILTGAGQWQQQSTAANFGYIVEWSVNELITDNNLDSLNGRAGNNTLYGNSADNSLSGGADNDIIIGGAGRDTINTGAGFNRAWGGEGADWLYGGSSDDILYGDGDNDRMWGYEGNDRLYGGVGADNMRGGDGDDVLFGDGGNDTLQGNLGNDTLIGGAGSDSLLGNGGDDILLWDGSDEITGNAGFDTMAIAEGYATNINMASALFQDEVERYDLRSGAANTITNVTSTEFDTLANLYIRGDTGGMDRVSSVQFTSADRIANGIHDGTLYARYSDSGDTLWIEIGMRLNGVVIA